MAVTRTGEPPDYASLLSDIAEMALRQPESGEVATYIPELARVDPHKFGIALQNLSGDLFFMGDADERFSTQSIAKVLALACAIREDSQALWKRVGVEPSGDPFNSLVQLEYEGGRPRNPFINSGALVVCDLLVERLADPKRDFLEFVRTVSGISDVAYDPAVAASEFTTGFRNRAHLNLMRAFGNIKGEIDEVLDFYVHVCSLAMSCIELARAFSFLAYQGHCLPAARDMLTADQVRRINALMLTCGFYDESGEFAFRVGLAGKSGVGGGIIAVCPGRFSVATWSPRLGPKGNSILGTEALCMLARQANVSIF